MTAAAARLRQQVADSGVWGAELVALAPELALLCADMADALTTWHREHHPFCDTNDGGDICDCSYDKARALLARLDTLTQETNG